MERCKTCQHWEEYDANEWGGMRGAGTCHAARPVWTVKESTEDPDTGELYRALLPEHAGVLSMVEDGSGYKAVLMTMPDFGCIQHKVKP